MRSNAEFFVERPVLFLVLRGAVVGLEATGALERGGLRAGRITTARSGFRRGHGFGRRLAEFHFWGRLVGIQGVEGRLVCYECT